MEKYLLPDPRGKCWREREGWVCELMSECFYLCSKNEVTLVSMMSATINLDKDKVTTVHYVEMCANVILT